MTKRLLPIVLAGFALTLAACGGDEEPSAEEYAMQLDGACATYQEKLENVPKVQSEEGLTLEESRELPVQYADEFEAEVEALTAPADLEETAQALEEALASPPSTETADPQAFLPYYEELLRLYEALGADGCGRIQAEGIDTLEQFQEGGLFEDGAPAG